MSNARNSAAVLVLVRGHGAKREVLLIERSATVRTHQSQVAFPGGGTEPGEENDPARTALRECFEEVGVAPQHVKVSKTFSPVPTLTGNFFVVPVLGVLDESLKIDLVLQTSEVAHAEWVLIEKLSATRSIEFGFPVFQWVAEDQKARKVWGLTAIIFDLIFDSAPSGL